MNNLNCSSDNEYLVLSTQHIENRFFYNNFNFFLLECQCLWICLKSRSSSSNLGLKKNNLTRKWELTVSALKKCFCLKIMKEFQKNI